MRRVSTWLLLACGFWLVGLGLYFIVLRPSMLPDDLRYMGTTVAQIRSAVPGLGGWLQGVFTVMAGFLAAAGVLTGFVEAAALPQRMSGAIWAIVLSGMLSVVLMSAKTFALQSDCKW